MLWIGRLIVVPTSRQLVELKHPHACRITPTLPLSMQRSAPIMHLRNVNPYVESAFADWRKAHRLAPNASREPGPLPLPGEHQLAGTSSFGMSGVNAHALFGMSQPPASLECGTPGLVAMQRERHWDLSPALYLAARVLPSGSTRCTFLIDLAQPDLAYLCDHQVRSGTKCGLDCLVW